MEGIVTLIVYALGLVGFIVAVKQLVYIFSDGDVEDSVVKENTAKGIEAVRERIASKTSTVSDAATQDSVPDLSEKTSLMRMSETALRL